MKQTFKRKSKPLKYALILVLFSLAVGCIPQTIIHADAQTQSSWAINLYAQPPSNPITIQNQTNAVFAPFEQVQLIAQVTNNNVGQQGIDVSFQVQEPNSNQSITQIRNANTDQNGLATITFRIPNNQSFGIWQVFAAATPSTQPNLKGNLTFTVGYPVVIAGVQFFNTQGHEQTEFGKEPIKIQILLNNTASTSRNVNVTTDIKDSANAKIGQISEVNLSLNGSQTQVEQDFVIPAAAALGQATAEITVYSGSFNVGNSTVDIPFTDAKVAYFTITTQVSQQDSRNIAVTNATISSNEIHTGDHLTINATVANNGNRNETFNTQITYDQNQINTVAVSLSPNEEKELSCLWDTTNVTAGTYTIKVQIDKLPQETNLADNEATAGTVTISYPTVMEQAVSLFVLLLALTGIFTFTLLVLFVRRNSNVKIDAHIPNLPPTIPAPTLATSPTVQPTSQQAATITPESIIRAATLTQLTPESTNAHDPILAHLTKISSSAKRIQDLNMILKEEKEQLNKEIIELNKTIETQESTVKNYFDNIKREIKKLEDSCNDDGTDAGNEKSNTQ